MTSASHIREYLLANSPWIDTDKTVDQVLFGDGDESVAKVGVCWYPSMDTIVAANGAGCELVVTHEPLFWRHRLQRGDLVTVPAGSAAKLHLTDGSIVTCSGDTRFALRIDDDRRIVLDTGSITVQAKSIPGSTMTVETPLGDAVVVGTVFTITVNR